MRWQPPLTPRTEPSPPTSPPDSSSSFPAPHAKWIEACCRYTHEPGLAEESQRPRAYHGKISRAGGQSLPSRDLRPYTNGSSFEDLYRRHVQAVFRFALSVTGDRATAEDVTSEAFLALYRNLDSIDESLLPGWLLTVARNRARDLWRRRAVEQRYLEQLADAPVAQPAVLETWMLECERSEADPSHVPDAALRARDDPRGDRREDRLERDAGQGASAVRSEAAATGVRKDEQDMKPPADGWDRDERDAIDELQDELESLQARHRDDPPIDLAARRASRRAAARFAGAAARSPAERCVEPRARRRAGRRRAVARRGREDRLLARIQKDARRSARGRRSWIMALPGARRRGGGRRDRRGWICCGPAPNVAPRGAAAAAGHGRRRATRAAFRAAARQT